MSQFHFDPATYGELIAEIPAYEELQGAVAAAGATARAGRVLDLGAGTGATAAAVLARHPAASLVLLDESRAMLAVAMDALPAARVERPIVGNLLDPLPAGPFDLVVSALAIHHLEHRDKCRLFQRVRAALTPDGRFVMGDVIVPDDPSDAVTPLSPGFDRPSRLGALLDGLTAAGFTVAVTWRCRDLVVIRADCPGPRPADRAAD